MLERNILSAVIIQVDDGYQVEPNSIKVEQSVIENKNLVDGDKLLVEVAFDKG